MNRKHREGAKWYTAIHGFLRSFDKNDLEAHTLKLCLF
jgi:hypothetical protein